MKRVMCAAALAWGLAAGTAVPMRGAGLPACDPDNGGLKLPDGFCALVVADNLGAARHMVVAANGDLYVSLMEGRGQVSGIVGLRDTTGDGKMDVTEKFGDKSSTGLAIRNGYIYVATISSVERFKLTPGRLAPGPAEVVVADLPVTRPHQDKGLAFDGRGGMYVSIGAPSNACQAQDRRPKLAGQDPCPLLEFSGGVWKFDENTLGQKQADGVRFATGLRQMPALTWHDGALYTVMNGRDQIDTLWSDTFVPEDNQTRPAEVMYKLEQNGNYGWPFCFYDFLQNKNLLNPEYGGDGKTVGKCDTFKQPIATFPAHWAPVDVQFYTGTHFPAKYRGGAFVAFHGSWNRSPALQDGYNVSFQPFAGGKPSGKYEVFADGFAGAANPRFPNTATYRADGVAQNTDGTLYLTESVKGRVWRVIYRGTGAN